MRYYVKWNTAFTITGPNGVTTGSTVTFTLNPASHASVNILWQSSSSILAKNSLSSASATFTANSTGSGNVTAYVVINGSTVQLASKTVSATVPATISDPSFVCSGYTATFTAGSPPSGYTWTCSSNLTPGTASGNNRNFTAQNNTTGLAWVAINNGTTEVVRKNILISTPPLLIATPQNRTVSINTYMTVTPSVPDITGYRWAFASGTNSAYANLVGYGTYAAVRFNYTGIYTLYGYGIRSCGESNTASMMYVFIVNASD